MYYGSTWFVTTIVITAIILLALLANMTIMKWSKPNLFILYALLVLSLIIGMFVSAYPPSLGNAWIDCLVMTIVVTMPLFFSGLVFSSEVLKAPSVGSAMYTNLLGAMLGGFLQYNAMYFGLRSLYVLAIVLYVLAFTSGRRSKQSAPSLSEPSLDAPIAINQS